jgi:hypothetical protein
MWVRSILEVGRFKNMRKSLGKSEKWKRSYGFGAFGHVLRFCAESLWRGHEVCFTENLFVLIEKHV